MNTEPPNVGTYNNLINDGSCSCSGLIMTTDDDALPSSFNNASVDDDSDIIRGDGILIEAVHRQSLILILILLHHYRYYLN